MFKLNAQILNKYFANVAEKEDQDNLTYVINIILNN
jgi:hypothetical protein